MSSDTSADTVDLDAQVHGADPDRWLASRFIADPRARADVIAVLAFDNELARAPKVASSPLLGEVRLTWWGEVLDEAFGGAAVRRHPVAQALADVIRRRSLGRAPLEAMIDARYRELDPTPMSPDEAIAWARAGAGSAAVVLAMILDPAGEVEAARSAGAAWALGRRAAKGGVAPALAKAALTAAREEARGLSVAAFPAVAYAALAGRPTAGADLARRLRLVWAVARGRI